MAETISGLVTEARRNRYSLIPPLSEEDVITVWEVASAFVERQMVQQKGVAIPILGTFTFFQKKIDVGSNKFIIIQRPVFVVSEKFVHTHSLHYTKQHTSGQIPIVPLNFTILANETPFDRDTVESCVKEVLQALSRSLAARKNIDFEFSGIGRLAFRDGKVKMKFFRDFILTLDSTGEMENAFRPETARSELSIISRPRTSATTLTLPRIVEPSKTDVLNLECSSARPSTTASTEMSRLPLTPQGKGVAIPEDILEEVNDSDVGEAAVRASSSPRSRGRGSDSAHWLVPKPAGLVVGGSSPEWPRPLAHSATPSPASSAGSRVTPRTPREGAESRRSYSSALSSKPHFAVRPSTCSHSSQAGQELCYLCHQRAQRNIPVDVSEERQAKERKQDQLLQAYQHQRDLVALAREQATKTMNGHYNKEIASFNLEAAERKKMNRNGKTSEFRPSYVFEHRALTPAKHLKQHEYCSQLDEQVSHKQVALRQAQDVEEKLEREEQLQLAKELAACNEAYQRKKAQRMAQYQNALAEQVRMKPASLDKDEAAMHHQPVFGVHDVSLEKLKQEKERARSLFLEQLAMVGEKQRQLRQKASWGQQEEAEMLKRARNSLMEDQCAERQHQYEARRGLEVAWSERLREKQLEELQQSKAPSILLHQQCEKYHRCKQCQRRRHNMGKSNLLCETRYISGSRLMV